MTGNVSFSSPLFHVIIDNIQHYKSQFPTLPAGDTMRAHFKDVYTTVFYSRECSWRAQLGERPITLATTVRGNYKQILAQAWVSIADWPSFHWSPFVSVSFSYNKPQAHIILQKIQSGSRILELATWGSGERRRKRVAQGMRLVPALPHEISVKNTSPTCIGC